MLQWGAYREGKCDVSKIEICEYGIGLHIQKGFIWSHWSKTVLITPPLPTTISTTNACFWPRGLFRFVLSGKASLSHNFTNLVFLTSSLISSLFNRACLSIPQRPMLQKFWFRNLYPLSTCRLYLPFLNKTVTRISPPFGVYFSLVPGYFSDTRFNYCLPVHPPSLHSTPLLVKMSYVMFMVFKERCLAPDQVV